MKNVIKPKTKIIQIRNTHRFVRAIEINLEDLLQIMPQIPRIRSFIKSKIIVTIFL